MKGETRDLLQKSSHDELMFRMMPDAHMHDNHLILRGKELMVGEYANDQMREKRVEEEMECNHTKVEMIIIFVSRFT